MPRETGRVPVSCLQHLEGSRREWASPGRKTVKGKEKGQITYFMPWFFYTLNKWEVLFLALGKDEWRKKDGSFLLGKGSWRKSQKKVVGETVSLLLGRKKTGRQEIVAFDVSLIHSHHSGNEQNVETQQSGKERV